MPSVVTGPILLRGDYVHVMPVIEATIERRLLINYRVDADVIAPMLPAPFEPHLVNGWGVAGICLIRLGNLRPRGMPSAFGINMENAAHRIAVRWTDAGETHTGVYIPQRHSAARAPVVFGGRLFPGVHRRAEFSVHETESSITVALRGRSDLTALDASVTVTKDLRDSNLFASTAEASQFFKLSPAGFSPGRNASTLEALELRSEAWDIEPAVIKHVNSSFFDSPSNFPNGSITLDSALVMRNVPVLWHRGPQLDCVAPHEVSGNTIR